MRELHKGASTTPIWTYRRKAAVIPNKFYLIEEKDVIPPLCAFAASYHLQCKFPTIVVM